MLRVAQAVLLIAALGVAGFAVARLSPRPVPRLTVTSVQEPRTEAGARRAAEAFWGALQAGRPLDLCAMSTQDAQDAAVNYTGSCRSAAGEVVRNFGGNRMRIVRVLLLPRAALVTERISRAGTSIWRFVYRHGRWWYDQAAEEPIA